jgi:hypothetical protein
VGDEQRGGDGVKAAEKLLSGRGVESYSVGPKTGSGMRPHTPRKAKYGNRKVVVDGIAFASKKEASHYVKLKMMEKNGLIHNLTLQTPFPLTVNGVLVAKYIADFRYIVIGKQGLVQIVVEDVKGYRTPVYRLKKKLMLAVHGIDVQEV